MANNSDVYINPYAFVRTDWNTKPVREPPSPHNRYAEETLSGRMLFTLTTITPLFIKGTGQEPGKKTVNEFYHIIGNHTKKYLIPASSLKGMIRSVVEALGNSCYSQFAPPFEIKEKLPEAFQPCSETDHLCIGCRLFGFVHHTDKQVYKGNVFFSDAVPSRPCPPVFENRKIRSIGTPRPTCSRLYLSDENHIAGRKFYYHHENVIQGAGGRAENCRVVSKGSVFDFNVDFENISKEDFRVMLYSFVLENDMRHKIGYGKADGYGSIQIECGEIRLYNHLLRYSVKKEQPIIYTGESLSVFIDEQKKEFIKQNPAPCALEDLKRIWNRTIKPGTVYEYDTFWNRKKRQDKDRNQNKGNNSTGSYKKGKKWHSGDDDMTFNF